MQASRPLRAQAFIKRHRQVRVLEVIQDFEGMDAAAFWHDVKFSLRICTISAGLPS